MRLLIMGPPGAGKGTQAALLAARLGVPAVSTGDIFRGLQTADSPLAEEVRAIMASGQYVSDALSNRIVAERLAEADCGAGFLLDGYPRTLDQVRFLDGLLAEQGQALDAVLCLEADVEEVVLRLAARATRDGRADDTAAAIRVRMGVYADQTRPLLDVYEERSLLRRVDGLGTVPEVSARLDQALPPTVPAQPSAPAVPTSTRVPETAL